MKEKKAKIVTTFLLILGGLRALYADVQIPQEAFIEKLDIEPHEDELIMLERMVKLSHQQWVVQCKVKDLLIEYKKNRELFLKGDQSKLHASYMIRDAREAKQLIYNHHLVYLFSSDFLEELALLAQVGKEVASIPCVQSVSSTENLVKK